MYYIVAAPSGSVSFHVFFQLSPMIFSVRFSLCSRLFLIMYIWGLWVCRQSSIRFTKQRGHWTTGRSQCSPDPCIPIWTGASLSVWIGAPLNKLQSIYSPGYILSSVRLTVIQHRHQYRLSSVLSFHSLLLCPSPVFITSAPWRGLRGNFQKDNLPVFQRRVGRARKGRSRKMRKTIEGLSVQLGVKDNIYLPPCAVYEPKTLPCGVKFGKIVKMSFLKLKRRYFGIKADLQ